MTDRAPHDARDAARRVDRLLALRARLADPDRDLGARFVDGLVARGIATRAGARLALDHLEPLPTEPERQRLLSSVRAAPRCHVVLSANVAIAAYRALALALVSAPHVVLKPSRRDPVLADLLIEAFSTVQDGAFSLERVDAVDPSPGEHVMAYGADATLDAIGAALPAGVTFDRHGTGFGVALAHPDDHVADFADRLARDVVAFDQRGCLSPRILFVDGNEARARAVAASLADALEALATAVPRPTTTAADDADVASYVRLVDAAAEIVVAGRTVVGLDVAPRSLVLPPPARLVHVVCADARRAATLLGPLAPYVTVIGASDPGAAGLAGALPQARIAPPGQMQRPPLDGPVDRRVPLVGDRPSD